MNFFLLNFHAVNYLQFFFLLHTTCFDESVVVNLLSQLECVLTYLQNSTTIINNTDAYVVCLEYQENTINKINENVAISNKNITLLTTNVVCNRIYFYNIIKYVVPADKISFWLNSLQGIFRMEKSCSSFFIFILFWACFRIRSSINLQSGLRLHQMIMFITIKGMDISKK